jgi:predicted TIM-barrel fold metal-dependent hydrolase
MMLIDTQLHLIDRRRLSYPWLAARAPMLDRDWSLADYAVTAARTGIAAALHMEVDVAEADIDAETDFVREAMQGGLVIGGVSACRPERADFADWLDRLDRRVVRGLRRILHEVPDDVSQDPAFRAGLAAAGRAGLPFDLCVRADQLALAADLVDACPGVTFVLDHCGNPQVALGGFDAWAGPLAALARRDNVNAKLSGLLAQTGRDWSLASLRPYVEHLIGAFGWERVVWGSDSPVVTLGGSLSDWVAATRALLEGVSADERAALYHRNAIRIWGLELDASRGLA